MTNRFRQARRFPSPLRYPGGKGKVANFVKLVMIENDLVGGQYIEPYAGGASIALSLLYEGYADTIQINDLDRGVHAFWWSVLHETDELCARLRATPVTMEEWHRQREVQRDPEATALDLGFSTFFLNRTNRSGIISGGVIGGQKQHGRWTLDARFNKERLERRITKVARHGSRIVLTNLDAAELLRQVGSDAPGDTLVYLDPPYYVKGAGLYTNHYLHQDHEEIAALLSDLPALWIVSYDAVEPILDLYGQTRQLRYALTYTASATRDAGSEVMYFHPDLITPALQSPAHITMKAVDRRMSEYVTSR